jgi:hypothetical protein
MSGMGAEIVDRLALSQQFDRAVDPGIAVS